MRITLTIGTVLDRPPLIGINSYFDLHVSYVYILIKNKSISLLKSHILLLINHFELNSYDKRVVNFQHKYIYMTIIIRRA